MSRTRRTTRLVRCSSAAFNRVMYVCKCVCLCRAICHADHTATLWCCWRQADNGPADLGTVDTTAQTTSFRGRKGSVGGGGGGGSNSKTKVWEGGHRVVGLATMPCRIPAGRVISGVPVINVDWLPTIAASWPA